MKTLKIFSITILLMCSGKMIAQDANANGSTGDNPVVTTANSNQENGSFFNWEAGIRFMPVFSSFDVRTVDNGVAKASFAIGYGYGLKLGYNFTEHVGIQTEYMYNTLAQKWRDKSFDRRITLNYINVPVMLSLNTGKDRMANLNFVLGPQFGLNVGSDLDAGGSGGVDSVTAILAVRKGDIGIAYGLGGEFRFGAETNWQFDVGFRGVYGLLDISDKSKTITTNEYYILDRAHVKTYGAYVGVAYLF
jgi:hypothetical protein